MNVVLEANIVLSSSTTVVPNLLLHNVGKDPTRLSNQNYNLEFERNGFKIMCLESG